MSGSLAGVSCLVTGAGGFLGQWIVQMLLEEEEALAQVRLLDIAFPPRLLRICDQYQGKTKLQLLKGDIQDAEFLHRACQDITLVIHTAAIIDSTGQMPKEKLMGVNVRGTQMVLEASKNKNVKYLIFTSSVEVMGPNNRGDPIVDGNEDLLYSGSDNGFPYGESKKIAEQSVLDANGQRLNNGGSLATCSLRCMYIFGAESRFIQVQLDEAIRNNNIFKRFSKKEALVNPVYVGNAAWAHIQAAKAMMDPGRVSQVAGQFYYISDDTPYISYSDLNYELGKEIGFGIQPKMTIPLSLRYFFAFVLEMVHFLLSPFVNLAPPNNRHMLNLVNTPFTFSYRKAHKDFGYKPRYTWAEAKRITTQWMADQVPQGKEFLKHHKQL